jgi:hypothetical protein
VGIDYDPAAVNQAALEWARTYTYDLVGKLNDTTRGVIREALATFQSQPGMTRGDIEQMLRPAFTGKRAEMIAITEVTRASSQANLQYQQQLAKGGITTERVWLTNRDERVCGICGPLHNQNEEMWSAQFPGGPPAHQRCRCAVGLEIKRPKADAA